MQKGMTRWRGKLILFGGWVGLAVAQLLPPHLPGGDRELGSPQLLFWIVVVAAAGCVITSAALYRRAWIDGTAELGVHAVFFMGVSLLPFVHGLTTPGILYGPNEATMSSVLWSVPVACFSALPIVLPARAARALLRRWRGWTVALLAIQVVLAVALLIEPSTLPSAQMGSLPARLVAIAAVGFVIVLSLRHLRLFEISGRPASLAVAGAYAAVGAGYLVWIADAPMTIGFWIAHAVDIAGVVVGTVVAAIAYRRGELEQRVLAPLVARDPLDALQLGLNPIVRRFMADLARKDLTTQIHVARTAETAMSVGDHLRLSPRELHLLGLGALLHDIGKLEIDSAILTKPGRLTDDEFEVIKTHAVLGERMMLASPELVEVAPIVRHHHERIDGRGYPDGLIGPLIPPLARIVSVCDAYDAMVHTRQYRTGMGVDKAQAILREHAGTQWDPKIVAALLHLAARDGIPSAPTKLANVASEVGCSCTHELPVPARI